MSRRAAAEPETDPGGDPGLAVSPSGRGNASLKRMGYQFAAAATALIHLMFILFVIAGGFLVLRWPKLMWIHLPAATWGALIEFFGWYCPLTTWENYFLRQAGRAGYDGGFIAHYIMPLLYPPGLTRGHEIAIGLIVLAVNAAIYVKVFR